MAACAGGSGGNEGSPPSKRHMDMVYLDPDLVLTVANLIELLKNNGGYINCILSAVASVCEVFDEGIVVSKRKAIRGIRQLGRRRREPPKTEYIYELTSATLSHSEIYDDIFLVLRDVLAHLDQGVLNLNVRFRNRNPT